VDFSLLLHAGGEVSLAARFVCAGLCAGLACWQLWFVYRVACLAAGPTWPQVRAQKCCLFVLAFHAGGGVSFAASLAVLVCAALPCWQLWVMYRAGNLSAAGPMRLHTSRMWHG
jgi:hypothetical protein